MIKLFYVVLFVGLCFPYGYAQTNNFTANYAIILSLDKKNKADISLESMFGDLEKAAQQLDFILKVKGNKNLFFLKDKIYKNENAANAASLKSNYSGRVFINDSIVYIEYDGGAFNVKAIKRKQLPEWELLNESKTINGYTCLKATTTKVVRNNAGLFTFPITAWYCPEINSNLGPIGYGGLPGLIFELQGDKFVYGLKKITFNNVENISKLKDYKVVGQMELDMMIKNNLLFKQ